MNSDGHDPHVNKGKEGKDPYLPAHGTNEVGKECILSVELSAALLQKCEVKRKAPYDPFVLATQAREKNK